MEPSNNGHLISAHDLLKSAETALNSALGGTATKPETTLEIAKVKALVGIGRELEQANSLNAWGLGRAEAAKERRPTVVCFCGSVRFIADFRSMAKIEEHNGNIVLSFEPGPSDIETTALHAARKERLDELHLRRIDLCDEILVINVNGYVGESTLREIDYAKAHGKGVRYLERSILGGPV